MRSPSLDQSARRRSPAPDVSHDLSTAERDMILVKSLYLMAGSIAAVFSTLYLFKLGGFTGVSWFYVGSFTAVPLGFALAGKVMRRWSLGRTMAIGSLLLAGFFAVLPFVDSPGIVIMLLLGAANGIGESFCWAGINLGEYVAAKPERRAIFLGRMSYWNGIAGTAGPPVAGIIFAIAAFTGDERHGYVLLFALIVLSLLTVAGAALRCIKYSGIQFDFSDVGTGLGEASWRNALGQQLFRGLWNSALGSLATVLVLLAINSELGVSVVAAVGTIVGAVTSRWAGKVLQKHHHAYLAGALLVSFGLVGFATSHGLLSVLFLVLLIRGFDPFSYIATTRDTFTSMDRSGRPWTDNFSRLVEMEVALAIGRIVSFGAVLALVGVNDQSPDQVRQVIILLAIAPLLVGLLQQRFLRSTASATA